MLPAVAAAAETSGEETPPFLEEGRFDPEEHPTQDHQGRRKFIYGGVGFVLGAALIAGLIAIPERNKNEDAQAKADQVIAGFEAQGFVPPDKDLLVNMLGTDGGNVCVDPASALNEAIHRISLSNGAAFVGIRPVTVDSRIVQGELVILDVYCPDQAQKAREYLDGLKYDDVINTP